VRRHVGEHLQQRHHPGDDERERGAQTAEHQGGAHAQDHRDRARIAAVLHPHPEQHQQCGDADVHGELPCRQRAEHDHHGTRTADTPKSFPGRDLVILPM
jgi:hypothetical protein